VALTALDYPELDLADGVEIKRKITGLNPELIINAAAYTAVDKAEEEPERAFLINAVGVGAIAEAAEAIGARFVHISTDYVFDGTKGLPYLPSDTPSPLGVYGKSKLEGERLALRDCSNALVVRTAWLYAENGANFVKTMLRVMANRDSVSVVCDQVGTPTYAASLAKAVWSLASRDGRGILHFTDSGVASWYDFACAIQDEACDLGMLTKMIPVIPISTAEYPLPAPRPTFGILDKSDTWKALGGPANHWRTNLRVMLERIKHG
jgi:dTDP-4-dehydrorhamnose reductase